MSPSPHWLALITLATLALLFGCAAHVGLARIRYRVAAPATIGPEEFNRAYRVQMNTLENAVIFLPALWLAALYGSPRTAVVLGAVWVVARVWYAFAYARNPKSRGTPFVTAYAAWGALMALAAWGLFTDLLG
jgi:uncharacterized membrane protein YecN with MAPEG domain